MMPRSSAQFRQRVPLPPNLTLVLALAVLPGCGHEASTVAPLAASRTVSPASSDIAFPGPGNFVAEITNPWLAFAPGKTFRYEGESPDGHETIVVDVTNKTKRILGIVTRVVHDRGYINGSLVEDTFDWYAQDVDGNVWYFGEDSKQIENGHVIGTEGSWQAGVNGASPGIIMLAHPQKGDSYQQEFAEGVAEDMARVVSLSETAAVPYGTFTGCLETLEWTPLEPGAREYKFYASGVGQILELGKHGERIELVAIE